MEMEGQAKILLQRHPLLFASFSDEGFPYKSFAICSKPHDVAYKMILLTRKSLKPTILNSINSVLIILLIIFGTELSLPYWSIITFAALT